MPSDAASTPGPRTSCEGARPGWNNRAGATFLGAVGKAVTPGQPQTPRCDQIAMWRPPSTLIVSPVTNGASARRKCTALAMSSGVPSRRSGVAEMIR